MKPENKQTSESSILLHALRDGLNCHEHVSNDGITELQLKNDSGQGSIDQITFDNGLTAVNIDVNLKEDLVMNIPTNKNNILYFFYNLEGICYHSFDNSEKYSKIDELKTVVVATSRYKHNILVIKKHIPFKCNIITINKDTYMKNFECPYKPKREKLSKLTKIFDMLRDYLFECSHNLNITEQLRSIRNISMSECVSSVLQLQSRYQLILSQHIEQMYHETYTNRESYDISRHEIQKIRAITEHIIDNPGLNHSQDNICSQFFISQSKLQSGFKAVHNHTVSNFTRKVRLDKAQELLINSDLNVSEIVYTIGFTSRSYFSKIFKQHFGCNPTAYKHRYKSSMSMISI
ncbi:MAG: helix-turn-helix transcriptional regulator [Algicola sp.]|nr:helix-turn-helix transcriptional regulator [Algicola sp.]